MAAIIGVGAAVACAPDEPPRELRVCSDPNNLPFSNEQKEGFENRLAELVARELGAELSYTWHAQRRGFIRNTLRAGECDLVMGVPSSFELALPTDPYYRSTYVFLYRRDRELELTSLDDERLRHLSVGVHVIGDDYTNTPPAHALASRGIIDNVRGYSVYGDYSRDNPPARLVEAVADGTVDVAVVWGPFAGYFGPKQSPDLEAVPVSPRIDLPFLPMAFDISMAVHRQDSVFRDELNNVLARTRSEIDTLLAEFGIPTLPVGRSGSPRAER